MTTTVELLSALLAANLARTKSLTTRMRIRRTIPNPTFVWRIEGVTVDDTPAKPDAPCPSSARPFEP